MLTKKQITENVFIIIGEGQEDVARAIVRFQEFYENKELKGHRDITVRQVEAWWDKQKEALETDDSYYQYWTGFNVPGRIFLDLVRLPEFRESYYQYNIQETELLFLLQDIPIEKLMNGYIIGMWKDVPEVLDHEIAHAYFATIPAYKVLQLNNVSKLPSSIYTSIHNQLSELGYAAEVINDEIQAYFSTYTDSIKDSFETVIYDSYVTPFVETFNKFHTNSPS